MPLLKDGSFLLDDSSCDPYGVVKLREKVHREKKSKAAKAPKKSGTVKKK